MGLTGRGEPCGVRGGGQGHFMWESKKHEGSQIHNTVRMGLWVGRVNKKTKKKKGKGQKRRGGGRSKIRQRSYPSRKRRVKRKRVGTAGNGKDR